MDDSTHPLTDRQLLEAVRDGSDGAWTALVARHRAPVEAVLRASYGRRGVELTDRAFQELRRADVIDNLEGNEASAGFGIRAVRPRAMSLATGGTYSPWPPAAGTPDEQFDVDDGSSVSISRAFGRLSMIWQTVLWHRWVDGEPAAAVTATIGRTPAEVVAVEAAAERGLFESYLAVEMETEGLVDVACRPTVGLLGAYASGTLADSQRRAVEAHVGSVDAASTDTATCEECRRRLELGSRLSAVVPAALVPGITAMDVDRYRRTVGASAAVGAAGLAARRSDRANRRARVGAVIAVAAALLLAAILIRSPLGDLQGEIADLLERPTPTTTSVTTTSAAAPPSDGPPDPAAPSSRIELVFPGVPQGFGYVPGGPAVHVGLSLSVPAPVYRNGTGTVDATLTNETETARSIDFVVRTSSGVWFDVLADGAGTCRPEGSGAQCTLDLDAGRTTVLSLRFALDATAADRLLVVPSIAAPIVDVPIETVPGLVLGLVGRGDLAMTGNTFGPCPTRVCADGERTVSAADLAIPAGAAIDRAVLLWSGPDTDAAAAASVVVTPPGGGAASPVAAERRDDDDGFLAVADVTALVRAGGAGTYAVERAGPADTAGAWVLVVVTRDDTSPRRLMVAVDPFRPATPDEPAMIEVPISSPTAGTSPGALRPTEVRVLSEQRADGRAADIEVDVNGEVLEPPGTSGAYALEIDANEDPLTVRVSATRALGVSAIGAAIDIVT
jgi:hypothetical protein